MVTPWCCLFSLLSFERLYARTSRQTVSVCLEVSKKMSVEHGMTLAEGHFFLNQYMNSSSNCLYYNLPLSINLKIS